MEEEEIFFLRGTPMAVQIVTSTQASSVLPAPPPDLEPNGPVLEDDVTRALLREMQRHYDTLSALISALQRAPGRPLAPTGLATPSGSPGALGAASEHAADPAAAWLREVFELARLEGALLMARTAAHLINNDLTATVGLIGIVQNRLRGGQPVDPRLLDDAVASARRAAQHLRELQKVVRLELQADGGSAPAVLDLVSSRRRARTRGAGRSSLAEATSRAKPPLPPGD